MEDMPMPKLEVHLRGGFSDRNGIKPENTTLQMTDLDQRTRIALINAVRYIYSFAHLDADYLDQAQAIYKDILFNVYLVPSDPHKEYGKEVLLDILCDTIEQDPYDSVLTVVEYFAKKTAGMSKVYNMQITPAQVFNAVFEREYVGYRFVGDMIVPITDKQELQTIEEAVASPYDQVNGHFEKALAFLSDRDKPDYANSIKESISAVERMCSLIVGSSTTLGAALSSLEGVGVTIHPAMKGAFDKLYGYTSDASGIRHAGTLGGADATFEEAKFMLVACCAFVNYLKGVQAKQLP